MNEAIANCDLIERQPPGRMAMSVSRGVRGASVQQRERRPTLEQLLPLARYYGVTIGSLVDAPHTADPRIDLRPMSGTDGAIIIPLTRGPGGIQA